MKNDLSAHCTWVANGRCTLVGAGPGDPELLTLKALKAIQAASVLFVDDLVNPDIVPQVPKLVVTDIIKYGAGIAGALFVLAMGKYLQARRGASGSPA